MGYCKNCGAKLKWKYDFFTRINVELLSAPIKVEVEITSEDLLKVF
jgi:hypothetical protein